MVLGVSFNHALDIAQQGNPQAPSVPETGGGVNPEEDRKKIMRGGSDVTGLEGFSL